MFTLDEAEIFAAQLREQGLQATAAQVRHWTRYSGKSRFPGQCTILAECPQDIRRPLRAMLKHTELHTRAAQGVALATGLANTDAIATIRARSRAQNAAKASRHLRRRGAAHEIVLGSVYLPDKLYEVLEQMAAACGIKDMGDFVNLWLHESTDAVLRATVQPELRLFGPEQAARFNASMTEDLAVDRA